MNRLHLNFETVASVCAIITSIIALFVAWDQSVVMRAQQHASVLPIVNSDVTINQSEAQNYIEFVVKNVGVGPAMIRDTKLFINEQPIEQFATFQELLFVGSMNKAISINFASFNGVLGAGESRNALKMWWPRSEISDADFVAMAERFVATDIHIAVEQCYCSVFEKCFVSKSSDTLGPVAVQHCETDNMDPVQLIKLSMQEDQQ